MNIRDDYSAQGFQTIAINTLDEYRVMGIHLRHMKSGAELYRIHAEDSENLSAFCFHTPPFDSSGVSHILEHCVLCGSRNFPMKDPFLVMINGSVHTFLNAITYPDKTMYPSASVIKADFVNLMRVYADAVFFPLLKPEVFQQEAHRVELNEEGKLIYSGVVFNEMKGVFSSPEQMAGHYSMHSLFEEGPYSWISGGEPKSIPNLTYEAFMDYYQTYYHPSNCRIFLYGNHDMEEILSILDEEYLSNFSSRPPTQITGFQPRWRQPKYLDYYYSSNSSAAQKTTITMNWLLGDSTDTHSVLASRILSELLLGHSGSPIREAITESGIGEDIFPYSGLETDLRETVFSVGVRGAEAKKRDDFVSLVREKLQSLTQGGIPMNLLEGAMRQVEFQMREIGSGRSLGLRLMYRTYRGWLYGMLPFESLAFERHMKSLRSVDADFFQNWIAKNLIHNSHHSILTISPDNDMQKKRDEEESKRLKELSLVLDSKDVRASMKQLRIFQETPDSEEDLAKIPFLAREELPVEVKKIKLIQAQGGQIHEVFSNGIGYLAMAFDLSGLNPVLRRWLPLFCQAFTSVGIAGTPHSDLSAEIELKMGDISCSLDVSRYYLNHDAGGSISPSSRPDNYDISDECAVYLIVFMKTLNERWEEAVDLMGKIFKNLDFSDERRVGDKLLELRNDFRAKVIPSGHFFSSVRASSRHSAEASWDELWYGIEQLCFLEEVCESSGAAETASKSLRAIGEYLFHTVGEVSGKKWQRRVPSVLVTGNEDWAYKGLATVNKLVSRLNFKGGTEFENDFSLQMDSNAAMFSHPYRAESLCALSAVNFSSLSLPAPILGSPEHARLGVLAHVLSSSYLWETIRMKGGAYGAFVSLSAMGGNFTFTTYRDPEIVSSLDYFHNSLVWAKESIDESITERAVIGCVGKALRPLSPEQKCLAGLKRSLYNIDNRLRQSHRNYQLKITAQELRDAADNLLNRWNEHSISIIGGRQALNKAIDQKPFLGEHQLDIPS